MVKPPKLYALDLFAGCGGLSLGLAQAGFETLAYSEINKDAADTFELNLGTENLLRFGDVASLSNELLGRLLQQWKSEKKDIDVVAGGPPCQGYSGIGHRRSYQVEKHKIPSNHLFKEMVRVIRAVRPKTFVFENVKGLLSGRWTAEGEKGEIWDEVRETFGNLSGYEIGWQLVQARDFGVPQNRPRVLLVGVRQDLGIRLDPSEPSNAESNPRGLLPKTVGRDWPDLIDVLGDLDDPDFESNRANSLYLFEARSQFARDMRLDPRSGEVLGAGSALTEQEYTRHAPRIREKFEYMLANHGAIHDSMKTKKFAQRLLPAKWGSQGPTITATSLPDDFVHYNRPRILTVREWARLQTFPDWFRFCGPRTTGGVRRAGQPNLGIWDREVPKYTQIGNAVPVRLAQAVGLRLRDLLDGGA